MTCSVPVSSAKEWLGTGKKNWSPMKMNIYVTDPDPQICARNLDSFLLKVQIMQMAVLLSTVAHKWSAATNALWIHGDAHCGHVRWIENSNKNLDWTQEYAIMLLVEYANRFKHKHAGSWAIYDFMEIYGNPIGLEPEAFLNDTKDDSGFDFGYLSPTEFAYREYLVAKWGTAKYDPTWGERLPPSWYMERINTNGVHVN